MRISMNKLMEIILKQAEAIKSISAFHGDHYDGAYAERLEEQVKFYKLGMVGEVPEEWKKFIPPPSPEILKSETHPLQFEYCECGCHGHEGTSKGLSYWILNDLANHYDPDHKKQNGYHVHQGHGPYGKKIGTFSSHEEAVIAAQNDFDKAP